MKNQVSITTVTLSILQTSLDQFRVFKAGSVLLILIIGLGITFAAVEHFHLGPVRDVPVFRVSIFSKSSRTVFEISVTIPKQAHDFPEQVKFILKGLLLIMKNGNLMHIFGLIFPETGLFPNIFPEQGRRNFPRRAPPR